MRNSTSCNIVISTRGFICYCDFKKGSFPSPKRKWWLQPENVLQGEWFSVQVPVPLSCVNTKVRDIPFGKLGICFPASGRQQGWTAPFNVKMNIIIIIINNQQTIPGKWINNIISPILSLALSLSHTHTHLILKMQIKRKWRLANKSFCK